MLRPPLMALTLLSCGLLAGCSTASNVAVDGITRLISPYRADIVQGNVITREQVALIQPGKTTRAEVRDALGSPLLADAFHTQRWDYAFSLRRDGKVVQRRDVVILFDGETVKSVEAPELPSEREFVTSINPAGNKPAGPEPRLALSAEERAALVAARPAAAPAPRPAAPQGATRPYPPLEPL